MPDRRLTVEECQRYLVLLRRCGVERYVAATMRLLTGDVNKTKREVPEFAQDVDDAIEVLRATIEGEVYRRAIEGYEEDVYRNGALAGKVRKWSDPILALFAKRHIPAYRDSVRVEQSGHVRVDHGLEPLKQLSDSQRAHLREIVVEAEGRSVPDVPPVPA